MNLPEFILAVPFDTVLRILLLAVICGAGVLVHHVHPESVDMDDSLERAGKALEEIRRV